MQEPRNIFQMPEGVPRNIWIACCNSVMMGVLMDNLDDVFGGNFDEEWLLENFQNYANECRAMSNIIRDAIQKN